MLALFYSYSMSKKHPLFREMWGCFVLALLPGATIPRAATLFELHRLKIPQNNSSDFPSSPAQRIIAEVKSTNRKSPPLFLDVVAPVHEEDIDGCGDSCMHV
jgi:hypothetical protein